MSWCINLEICNGCDRLHGYLKHLAWLDRTVAPLPPPVLCLTMANDLAKAEWWRDFILARCPYPAIGRLIDQFARATPCDFCPCGCNSFGLSHHADSLPEPIAERGGYGAVFESDFLLSDGKTLEIILFADNSGCLTFVEIDCCGNSFPVPDIIEVDEPPFHVHSSKKLLPS